MGLFENRLPQIPMAPKKNIFPILKWPDMGDIPPW